MFQSLKSNCFSGDKCWIGHYCPSGTAIPIPCSPGTYMNHTQADECYICPAGHYCVNRETPEPCPAGKDHALVVMVIGPSSE